MNDLLDFLKTIKHIVEIEIPTVSGIGPRIWSKDSKYCGIVYRTDVGFLISCTGTWLNDEEAMLYAEKLTLLSKIVHTLNKLYKP